MYDTTQLTYDDVLIDPDVRSDIASRFDSSECNPFIHGRLPIVSSPMDSIPSEEFISAAKDRIFAIFSHRFQSVDRQLEHIAQGAQGVISLSSQWEDIERMVKAGAQHLLVDVANGGNVSVPAFLQWLQPFRDNGVSLWAGNVSGAITYREIAPWCDFVRVGIGNGSVCTTRIQTGCGRGSISSLLECNRVRERFLSSGSSAAAIVADGGIKENGDIAKALAAGASLVMLGRMFAATKESAAPWARSTPWWKFWADSEDLKVYRGMASKQVNMESGRDMTKVSVEGHQTTIWVRGSVVDVLSQIESNLRSAMSYVNAHDLTEFRKSARLLRVSPSVYLEGLPHAR